MDATRAVCVGSVCLLLAGGTARAAEPVFAIGGRLIYGVSYRLDAPDPALLNTLNAAASGQVGRVLGGQNSDDADTNFRRHDATSNALQAYVEASAADGPYSLLLRGHAWRDVALRDGARDWGNSANGYRAGAPLSDAGAPTLSRFSGALLSDYYLQYQTAALLLRAGQQSIAWGARGGVPGGIAVVNGIDLPALHRPGTAPQDTSVAAPALYGRARLDGHWSVDAYVQTRFRPSGVDMCGTLWSVADYAIDGCDKVFAGAPAASDRQRIVTGSYLQRLPMPLPVAPSQHGVALLWQDDATEIGLFRARYTSRGPLPGLQKSTRVGAALIAGDPDGKNLRFFTTYLRDIEITSLTLARRVGQLQLTGELSYRPNQPLLLSPSDVIGAFLSPTAPSLLRDDVNRTAPGALFQGSDRYRAAHAAIGLQTALGDAFGLRWSGGVDAIGKRVFNLPDPTVRRYGRADQFGQGPVFGQCTVTTSNGATQCSNDGYVSANAWATRLRLDVRAPAIAPGIDGALAIAYTADLHGWSYDNTINQGRRQASVALRVELRQRYQAELVWTPVWGGDYNAQHDRDQLALSVGIKF